MAGYKGYSMSNNAVQAYKSGEKPFSKWTKTDILNELKNYDTDAFIIDLAKKLSLKELKQIALYKSSWHHTSSMYNQTDFYTVSSCLDLSDFAKLNNLVDVKKIDVVEKWECEYLLWSGTRNHPKATTYRKTGVIKGNWFFPNGEIFKKSINSNGFKKIQKIQG